MPKAMFIRIRPAAAVAARAWARRFSGVVRTAEQGGKHDPYAPTGEGAGFYSRMTKGCYDVVANAESEVFASLDAVLASAPAGQLLRMADFGTADAGTSLPLLTKALDRLRAAGDERAVEIVYEDQPQNDWKSVWSHTSGALPVPGVGQSYMQKHRNIFPLAVGRSFYETCVAPGTVDLSMSFTAMHWLRACPVQLPDALHSACTEDSQALAAYREQARADWEAILLRRAEELRPGGRLVVVNFGHSEAGHYLGTTGYAGKMHPAFAEIWRELVTPEEFVATNFPNHYRTAAEIEAPFVDPEGPVSRAGLRLLSCEMKTVRCPFAQAWHDGEYQTADIFAQDFVPTTRTWSNSTFLGGLSGSRAPEEKASLVDELFARWQARVASDPDQHHMDYVHTYTIVEKRADMAS